MPNSPHLIRIILALAISLGSGLLLVVLLYITDLGFNVWNHLKTASAVFITVYLLLLIAIATGVSWWLWRVLVPTKKQSKNRTEKPLTEEELNRQLEHAEASGVDVLSARNELIELGKRRDAGELHVALIGDVSTGKSSLVKALLPNAEAEIGVCGGTTQSLNRYIWQSRAGDRLILTDMPGLNSLNDDKDEQVREEALRAHVVIYLVDGDITREQYHELNTLLSLTKPVILALNKMDRYRVNDLHRIKQRIKERIQDMQRVDVVTVSAAMEEEVTRITPQGTEERIIRLRAPQVEELLSVLQHRIDSGRDHLDQLRDAAVFTLSQRKLDDQLVLYRRSKARAVVESHTRQAVLVSMAAVSPGMDLILQGVVGYKMVQKLLEVYEVPADQIDIKRFLELAAKQVGKTLPLTLSLVGNVLKAFPGVGTVTGGLVHAIAYGLIFDSLGRTIAHVLEARGQLPMALTLKTFKEDLGEDLETRTRQLTQMALGTRNNRAKT